MKEKNLLIKTIISILILIFLSLFKSYQPGRAISSDNLFEYSYTQDEKGIIIEKYLGPMDKDIVFPSQIEGLPVVQLGDGNRIFNEILFWGDKIIVESSNIHIKTKAFSSVKSPISTNSESKPTLIFKNTIKSIDSDAFSNFCGFKTIIFPKDINNTGFSSRALAEINLIHFEIPKGLKPEQDLFEFSSIEYLYLNDDLSQPIKNFNFNSRDDMNIILKEGISQLNNPTFEDFNCKSISLPNSLKYLGYGTFNNMEVEQVIFNTTDLSIPNNNDPDLMEKALNFKQTKNNDIQYILLTDSNFKEYLPKSQLPFKNQINLEQITIHRTDQEDENLDCLEIKGEDSFIIKIKIQIDKISNFKIKAGSTIKLDKFFGSPKNKDDLIPIEILLDRFEDINNQLNICHNSEDMIEFKFLEDSDYLELKLPFQMKEEFIKEEQIKNNFYKISSTIQLDLIDDSIISIDRILNSKNIRIDHKLPKPKQEHKIYYHFLSGTSKLKYIDTDTLPNRLNKGIRVDNSNWVLHQIENKSSSNKNSLVLIEEFEDLNYDPFIIKFPNEEDIDFFLIGDQESLNIYRSLSEILPSDSLIEEVKRRGIDYLPSHKLSNLYNLENFINSLENFDTHIYIFYKDIKPTSPSPSYRPRKKTRPSKFIKEKNLENKEDLNKSKDTDIENQDQENLNLKYSPTKKSYIHGYDDGSFRPNKFINRGEFAQIIDRIFFNSRDNNKENLNHLTNLSIEKLYKKGIFNGYKDGSFRSNQPITRSEVLVVFSKLSLDEINPNPNIKFTDTSSHWARNIIHHFYEKELVVGYEDFSFRPDNSITRAEAITLINRFIKKKPVDKLKNYFHDVPKNSWFYKDVINASN